MHKMRKVIEKRLLEYAGITKFLWKYNINKMKKEKLDHGGLTSIQKSASWSNFLIILEERRENGRKSIDGLKALCGIDAMLKCNRTSYWGTRRG